MQRSCRLPQRRLCWLAALMVMALSLAACGAESSDNGASSSGSSSGGGPTSTTSTTDQADTAAPPAAGELGDLEKLPEGTDKLCGDKPIKLAQVDGFGANSWRDTVRKELESELKPCTNVKISYAHAGGDIQKYNTEINSFTAQGYDIIVTYDDFGPQGLPAIRKAFKAGVTIVPYTSDPGGKPGEDYSSFVTYDRKEGGKLFGDWLNKVLDKNGNVIFMGGVPGNPSSIGWMNPTVAATDPGIKWLQDKPVDTNWDPAQYTRVTAGLITKYPKIDAIVSDYGGAAVGEIRAFENAGKPHPPLATLASSNELACMYQAKKKEWPDFQMIWIEGTTRVVRWAARRALAEFNKIDLADPTLLRMFPFVDTTAGKEPKCRKDLPPDADLSSGLTDAELKEVFD